MEPVVTFEETLSDSDCKIAVDLVVDGGAVSRPFVEDRLPRALGYAVARLNGEIIGLEVAKNIRNGGYLERLNARYGFVMPMNSIEIGYLVVKPEYRGRGIAAKLLETLVRQYRHRNLFAITAGKTDRNLIFNGFNREGKEFKREDGTSLSLWFRWTTENA